MTKRSNRYTLWDGARRLIALRADETDTPQGRTPESEALKKPQDPAEEREEEGFACERGESLR